MARRMFLRVSTTRIGGYGCCAFFGLLAFVFGSDELGDWEGWIRGINQQTNSRGVGITTTCVMLETWLAVGYYCACYS